MEHGLAIDARQALVRAVELAGQANVPATRIAALGNLALIALSEERMDESREPVREDTGGLPKPFTATPYPHYK